VTRKSARSQRKKKVNPRPEHAKPKWIWLKEGDEPAKRVVFRKEFEVKGAIAAARLYATCDDAMTIYVDGTKVLESGFWDKPVFTDISKLIEKETPGGKHVLTVEGSNGT
jgi:hypothetical protein